MVRASAGYVRERYQLLCLPLPVADYRAYVGYTYVSSGSAASWRAHDCAVGYLRPCRGSRTTTPWIMNSKLCLQRQLDCVSMRRLACVLARRYLREGRNHDYQVKVFVIVFAFASRSPVRTQ